MELKNPLYKNIGAHVITSIFTIDKGEIKVLLIKRDNEPFKGSWALVSGAMYNNELIEAAEAGALEEVFGTGTAAVISPVGHLRYGDKVIKVQDGGIGPISQKLYDNIVGIQLGKIEGPEGWVVRV